MITNNILDRMRSGEKALGMGMTFPAEELVELAGRMGLDFVNFDGQHAPITPDVVERMCRIADGFGLTPTMRVPDQQESTILSYLDRGIRQITVPNVETRAQAEALVKYSYFAPLGRRSATSIRTVFSQGDGGRAELLAEVNANTIVVAQLESVTAHENLDEILSVEGLDFFGGGPEDLAQSMGLVGQHTHPRAVEAQVIADERIRAAGKKVFGDFTETIGVFGEVKQACEGLLEKHGRTSGLPW